MYFAADDILSCTKLHYSLLFATHNLVHRPSRPPQERKPRSKTRTARRTPRAYGLTDKDDCYVHTVEVALERAWQFYRTDIERRDPKDCFELIEATMLSMAALGRQHRHLAALYLRVVYAKDSHARDRLYRIFVRRNDEFFERVIPWGIESGLIDPELPVEVVRFHIHAVGSHLTYQVLSGDDPRWLPRSAKGLRNFVHTTVAGLARALAPQSSVLDHLI